MGADVHRACCRHGGMYSIFSHSVTGCRNNSPSFRCTSDYNRLVPVFREISLFNRCEKGIHIHMDDFSDGRRSFHLNTKASQLYTFKIRKFYKIGRASCRERVKIMVGEVVVKKKSKKKM